jgi:3-oxoadipate enol-lactonase
MPRFEDSRGAPLPVVLLSAFPLHSGMWADQLTAFGDRVVLTPDFPGFGEMPPGGASIDALARAVLEELARAEVDSAVFACLSMGGYVAFRVHQIAPGRIAGLVLADTRAGADDEAGREKRTAQAKRVREEGVGWMPDALLPLLLGETTRSERPEVVSRVREMIAGADPEGVARALEAMRDRPDSSPILHAITCPVLALVGEEDALTPPAESRAIAEAVPDGRLVIIPRAGHLSNLEAPEAFNEAIRQFLG